MRIKKLKLFLVVLVLLIIAVFILVKMNGHKSEAEEVRQIKPSIENIESIISTTGTVLPKNRLEVKPPVNGRIESIDVQEGQDVKIGQVLAWMSSTERAALLDAARGQGEDVLKYWKEVYKAIPLVSPIDGEVIVATMQPGQTVTTSDDVVVLSDRLIVRAQVDETDIGKVKLGEKATIALDAYPDVKINAVVDHLYYESKTVNNVTIYEVDLIPANVPEFFRSGMNASVDFIVYSKENALVIPAEAVFNEKGESYVFLKGKNSYDSIKRKVQTGISQDKKIEIVSGITTEDIIVIKSKKFALPKSNMGTNPFMPFRQQKTGQGR